MFSISNRRSAAPYTEHVLSVENLSPVHQTFSDCLNLYACNSFYQGSVLLFYRLKFCTAIVEVLV